MNIEFKDKWAKVYLQYDPKPVYGKLNLVSIGLAAFIEIEEIRSVDKPSRFQYHQPPCVLAIICMSQEEVINQVSKLMKPETIATED